MLTALLIVVVLFNLFYIIRQVRGGHDQDELIALEFEKYQALRKWPEFSERERIRKAKEEAYQEMIHRHNRRFDTADSEERYIRLLNEEQRLMREEFARKQATPQPQTPPAQKEKPAFLRKIMD